MDNGNVTYIATDIDAQDVGMIHRFLSEESAWARGIPIETVRQSIRNSLSFGLFLRTSQIAYARVISDYATFAYLLDVFVLKEHRGNGYSKLLMDAVMNHPQLQGIRRFVLVTSSAHGLYERYGFSTLAKPHTFMEIAVANPYGQLPA